MKILRKDFPKLLSPFRDWSNGGLYYFGLCTDRNGNIINEEEAGSFYGDFDHSEYHINYVGGGIFEIDFCKNEDSQEDIYRGKIPDRDFFIKLISNFENPIKLDS